MRVSWTLLTNNSRLGILNQYLTFCLVTYSFWKEYYLLYSLTSNFSLFLINYKIDGSIWPFQISLVLVFPLSILSSSLLSHSSPLKSVFPLCPNSPLYHLCSIMPQPLRLQFSTCGSRALWGLNGSFIWVS